MTSRLIRQPATYPWLRLNPEPMGAAIDGESVERYYLENFGPSALDFEPLVPAAPAKPARKLSYIPSARVRQFTRR